MTHSLFSPWNFHFIYSAFVLNNLASFKVKRIILNNILNINTTNISRDLSLTHAWIHPEKPLPAQTAVKLIDLRALADAIGVYFGAKDAQNRFPAFRSWPGALLRYAVDCAALLVIFQFEPRKLDCLFFNTA